MKTNLDTINRNIFKPEWTNHVYLSSFYKIQDIYCAELVISSTVVLKHSVKEYDLKNLFKSNELLIIYIKLHNFNNKYKKCKNAVFIIIFFLNFIAIFF